MSSDQPLTWTTLGNVPVASLQYFPIWTVSADCIQFVQEYRTAEGIVVRRDVHIYNPQNA